MINLNNTGAVLTVDVKAAVQNYLKIKSSLGLGVDSAVSIKTDAYGLGADKLAPSLADAGCKHFFTAHVFEGVKLRKVVDKETIYVLHGIPQDSEHDFFDNRLVPVLNSEEQILLWSNFAKKIGKELSAVIHVDTGMVRLGLAMEQFKKIMADKTAFLGINPLMLMSHLACADEPEKAKNKEQLELFLQAKALFAKRFPNAKYSFANSAGINLGKEYHFDLVRPGIAVYGGGELRIGDNIESMNPVVNLSAKILQIHEIDYPQTVGYGATWQAGSKKRIATIAAGYGDGLMRAFSNRLQVFIDGVKVSCVGRISMDLITLDVTDIPINDCQVGKFVEIIGKNNTISDVAAMADTINYEIITSLGKRYCRTYLI